MEQEKLIVQKKLLKEIDHLLKYLILSSYRISKVHTCWQDFFQCGVRSQLNMQAS